MNHRYFLYTLLALFLASCAKEPIASFTASSTSAGVGELISFTNNSTEATSFQWEFGDGATSTEENPTHAYSLDGSFNVELTAINEKGSSSASTTVVIAYPDPVADFSMDKTTAEMDEIVTFTNSSQNAATYSWSFGDGETSTEENTTHAYAEDGTYTIQLTATGPGGATNSTTKSVTITIPDPIADFTMDNNGYAAPGETVTFTNESKYGASYAWDFGDGTNSTVTNPTHAFPDEGIYTIQLTVTGLNAGTHSTSEAITIAEPPVAAFTMDKSSVGTDETITFTNESQYATSYTWDFGDGTTSTATDPTHSYSAEGTYSVQLIATGAGGSDSILKDVNVFPVNIFPGVGAGGVEIGDTWATIEGEMPADIDYQGYYLDGSGYVHHVYESLSLGVMLFLVSPTANTSPSSDDILWLMGLYDNYFGRTAEGLQMGSLLSEVVAAYGDPDRYDTEYASYIYDRLGIRFYYNDSDIIDMMSVFPADSKKSIGVGYQHVEDLRNIKSILQKK